MRRLHRAPAFVPWLAVLGLASCDLITGGSGTAGLDGGARDDGLRSGADAGRRSDGDVGGSPERIDVATWNIEFFPKDATTPDRVAEILRSLDLDLVAVQEIADQDAFESLVADLPGYDHVLSVHEYGDGSYQKIGFIFQEQTLDVVDVDLLFNNPQPECTKEGTYAPFPRPPLEVTFAVNDPYAEPGYTFTAIGIHLKAYFPPCDDDCRLRRACANRHLEAHVRDRVADPTASEHVLVLGDFNEVLDNGDELDPFAHWSGGDYEILTSTLGPGDYSYVHLESLIDHAVVTAALAPAFEGGAAQVEYLDREHADYTDVVSDHVPVVMSFDPSP